MDQENQCWTVTKQDSNEVDPFKIPLDLNALNMGLSNLCGAWTATTCAVGKRLSNSASKATLIKLKYLITLAL